MNSICEINTWQSKLSISRDDLKKSFVSVLGLTILSAAYIFFTPQAMIQNAIIGVFGLYGVTKIINYAQKKFLISKKDLSETVILDLVKNLNSQFKQYESRNPRTGYSVEIQELPTVSNRKFQGLITPHGNKRALNTQFPIERNSDGCVFCELGTEKTSDEVKLLADKCYSVISKSGQILVNPQKHYSHWFEVPQKEQVNLLRNMIHIRDEANDGSYRIRTPMGFHCGKDGGQTVFHVHGRTGVYKV